MAEAFKYDVFISHSAKDKAAVRELAKRLNEDHLKVWFDEWVIKPGDLIPAKVEEGLEQSRTLVLVMSSNSFASDWILMENLTARFRDPTNTQRRFIPIRLDDTEIKDSLRLCQSQKVLTIGYAALITCDATLFLSRFCFRQSSTTSS